MLDTVVKTRATMLDTLVREGLALDNLINAMCMAIDFGFVPYVERREGTMYRIYPHYDSRKGEFVELPITEAAEWLKAATYKLMVERPELSTGVTEVDFD